jgi:predicted Fe-S protein YdhL (DUF1289 family)
MSEFITKKPCIDMCDFNKHQVCKACGRTHAEKKSWKQLSAQEKQLVWSRILQTHGSGGSKAAKALKALYHKAEKKQKRT